MWDPLFKSSLNEFVEHQWPKEISLRCKENLHIEESKKKSHMRETLNLSTDADSITITIIIFSDMFFFFFLFWGGWTIYYGEGLKKRKNNGEI